jgi:transposase InsO family protein
MAKQGAHHIVRDQPVAVGGKAGVIPDRIVHTDADKPAIELFVIEVLAQLPLGAQSISIAAQGAQLFIRGAGVVNEHWFLNLAHAQAIIEAWRREYNEERPKKALGGLTPAAYARQLAMKSATVTTGL